MEHRCCWGDNDAPSMLFPGGRSPPIRAQGQAIANRDASAVQAAMARYDDLPAQVTAAIAQAGYPVGPVVEAGIQRVAIAMAKFGLLGPQAATAVEQGTLARSMVDLAA
jgi:hypothetical protein